MSDKEKKTPPKSVVVLDYLKSTKGTHVYGNLDTGITSVYLPKTLDVFQGNDDPPTRLELTIRMA